MKGLTCLRNNIHVYSTPECIYVMDGWFLSAARKNKHISSVENMFWIMHVMYAYVQTCAHAKQGCTKKKWVKPLCYHSLVLPGNVDKKIRRELARLVLKYLAYVS